MGPEIWRRMVLDGAKRSDLHNRSAPDQSTAISFEYRNPIQRSVSKSTRRTETRLFDEILKNRIVCGSVFCFKGERIRNLCQVNDGKFIEPFALEQLE